MILLLCNPCYNNRNEFQFMRWMSVGNFLQPHIYIKWTKGQFVYIIINKIIYVLKWPHFESSASIKQNYIMNWAKKTSKSASNRYASNQLLNNFFYYLNYFCHLFFIFKYWLFVFIFTFLYFSSLVHLL